MKSRLSAAGLLAFVLVLLISLPAEAATGSCPGDPPEAARPD